MDDSPVADNELEQFRNEWKIEVLSKQLQKTDISGTSTPENALKSQTRTAEILNKKTEEVDVPAPEVVAEKVPKKVNNGEETVQTRALNAYVQATRYERFLHFGHLCH